MIKLVVCNEVIQCDKVVKGADFIHCYESGGVIAIFEDIKDFSGYSLIGENGNSVPFALPEPTSTERISALEAAMLATMMRGDFNV